jgi:hypothetical protein
MTDPYVQTALNSPAKALDCDGLDTALRLTQQPAPELFRKIAASADSRKPSVAGNKLECLLAAFLLVELCLPTWEVRHLGYAAGEWRCALVPRTNRPLFESADAAHRLLSVAILRTLIAALCPGDRPPRASSSVPAVAQAAIQYVCCDNFA